MSWTDDQLQRLREKMGRAKRQGSWLSASEAGADAVPHTPGEEGLADMRVMASIYEAAAGGSTVKLPRVKELDSTRGMPLADENG